MVKISSLILKQYDVVCDKCNKDFTLTFDEDCYINLVDGSIRVKCPHCNTEYKIYIMLKPVEEKIDE